MQRRFPEFIEYQRRAEWNRGPGEDGAIDDIDGHTLLVVGYGSIGRALATRLAPFGAHVIGVARTAHDGAQPAPELPKLLPTADVVVNLLPLTPETEKIVDAAVLARLTPAAAFFHSGRGSTV